MLLRLKLTGNIAQRWAFLGKTGWYIEDKKSKAKQISANHPQSIARNAFQAQLQRC